MNCTETLDDSDNCIDLTPGSSRMVLDRTLAPFTPRLPHPRGQADKRIFLGHVCKLVLQYLGMSAAPYLLLLHWIHLVPQMHMLVTDTVYD